ncbi:MAG: hypothetical protein K9J27_01495 [Bacteroidales bacterium]|nr:hypothetical protein [Bacteroidales bacterium]MCF8332648.1 hypothetical protein [Bacteroidales bacterium]
MTFKKTVEQHSETHSCYKGGLKAMGGNSQKIKTTNTRLINGSVFLEECLANNYPHANLWDYMVSYNSKIYFIEVHPAETKNISEMINKVNWLKGWLKNNGAPFNAMKSKKYPYRWVASGRVNIARNSSQMRKLARSGIAFPQEITQLP